MTYLEQYTLSSDLSQGYALKMLAGKLTEVNLCYQLLALYKAAKLAFTLIRSSQCTFGKSCSWCSLGRTDVFFPGARGNQTEIQGKTCGHSAEWLPLLAKVSWLIKDL